MITRRAHLVGNGYGHVDLREDEFCSLEGVWDREALPVDDEFFHHANGGRLGIRPTANAAAAAAAAQESIVIRNAFICWISRGTSCDTHSYHRCG